MCYTIFFISNLGFWSVLKLLIYDRKISNRVAWRLLKSKLHLKREKYTYMGGNAKAKSKEEERILANLWNLRYTKEVLTGAESKPVSQGIYKWGNL